MRKRFTAITQLAKYLFVGLLVTARGALASPPVHGPPGNSRPTDALSASDLTTLQKLHDTHQMEIQMGHLAETKGASKAVKDFGKRLVHDHTVADDKIAVLLQSRRLDLKVLATTTSADPAHSSAADKGGAEFDRSFAAQMVLDHQKTIDLLSTARKSTKDPGVRELYDALAPVVLEHKRIAQTLGAGHI